MFRWVDHTSEVELELRAATRPDVFSEAVAGLADLFGSERDSVAHRPASRDVEVEAPDDPALLAAFLEELVFLAETQGFFAAGIEMLEIRDGRIRATLGGSVGDPQALVKAVTYHRLVLEKDESGWLGRVVLDV